MLLSSPFYLDRMSKLEFALVRLAALPASFLAAPLFVGSLGRERVGGVEQRASIRINAAPHHVHTLIDPAAEFNRWRIRGERIEAIDARAGFFRLFVPGMEDRPFELQVTSSTPAARLAATVHCEDRRPFGAIFSSSGVYDISPTNNGGSSVVLTETTLFLSGLPPFHLARHVLIMKLSMRMDLLRLKYEAETGRDADASTS